MRSTTISATCSSASYWVSFATRCSRRRAPKGCAPPCASLTTRCVFWSHPLAQSSRPPAARVLRAAESAVSARARKHARLTVAGLRCIRARAQGAPPGSIKDELTTAVTVAWFFLLRPEEVSADGRPGRRRSIRRDGVCFIRRVGPVSGYSWQECLHSHAEAVLLFLEGRKTDRTGYATVLPRWRSGTEECPVRALGRYVEAVGPTLAPDAPLFPRVSRAAFGCFLREEMALQGVADGGPPSPPCYDSAMIS